MSLFTLFTRRRMAEDDRLGLGLAARRHLSAVQPRYSDYANRLGLDLAVRRHLFSQRARGRRHRGARPRPCGETSHTPSTTTITGLHRPDGGVGLAHRTIRRRGLHQTAHPVGRSALRATRAWSTGVLPRDRVVDASPCPSPSTRAA